MNVPFRNLLLAAIGLGTLLSQANAQNTSLHWDLNGTATGSGVTDGSDRTWFSAGVTWSPDTNGALNSAVWSNNNRAVFSAGTDAVGKSYSINVTVTGGVDVRGITLQDGDLSLRGNAITLIPDNILTNRTGGNEIQVSGSNTLSIANVIDGFSGLEKLNPGTLTLTGASTYTGTTTITEGILNLGNGGTTGSIQGSSPIAISDGAELVLNRSNAVTLSNVISSVAPGNGDITKLGANTLTLTANSTAFTGTTTISVGSLNIGGNTSSGNISGDINLNGVGTSLIIHRTNAITLGAGISGTGSVTKNGTNTLTLNNSGNTYSGDTIINGGILIAQGGGAIGDSSAVTVDTGTLQLGANETIGSLARGGTPNGIFVNLASSTLTTGGNGSTTGFSGVISGTGGITKEGAGDFSLDGDNTYTGTTTINAGSLTLAGGFGSGAIVNNASLVVSRGTALTLFNAISGTGTLTKTSLANLTLDNAGSTYSGATTILSGTLIARFGGAIGDLSAVRLSSITFDAARLELLDNETIGSLSSLTDGAGGGSVDLNNSILSTGGDNSDTTFSGVISSNANGGITKTGTGTFTLTGTNTYTGTTTISGGTLQLGNGGVSGSIGGGTIVNNAALAINRSTDLTLTNTINGTGSLTKAGTATLTLDSNTANYLGNTVINQGTLLVRGANAIGNSSAVSLANVSGVTLQLGANETIGSLSGGGSNGGNVNLDNFTLTTGGIATIFSGNISGSGGLTVNNATVFTLKGTNSYSGTTTITGSGSTLNLGGGDAVASLGGGAISIGGLANFTLQGTNDLTLNNAISGAGSLRLSGTDRTYTLSGSVAHTGGTTIDSSNTLLLSGGAAFTASGISNAGSLIVNKTNTVTLTGITGAGSLTKNGSNTLNLNGTNNYTGSTIINAGRLNVLTAQSIGSQTAVSLANTAGAILEISNSAGIGSLSGGGVTGGNVNLVSGATLSTGFDNTDTAFGGNITGIGNISKNGMGTFTLTGNSTFGGITTISAGALNLGGGSASGFGYLSDIRVNGGGGLIFDNSSGNVNYLFTLTGGGSLTKQGAGTFTLTNNANDFGGGSTITAGTLRLSGNGRLGNGAVSISDGASFTLDQQGALSLSNAISGLGTLNKVGGNTLTLTGNNSSHQGATVISGGILFAQGENAIGNLSAVSVAAGANLFLSTSDQTIGSLAGGGSVLLLGRTLTTGGNGTTTTFSGVLSDSGNLVKVGTGIFTLTSNNTFIGTTTINGGTLNLGGGGTTGSVNNGAIVNNALLLIDRSNDFSLNNSISGTGSLTKVGANTLTLTGVNTYSGGTTISDGTLILEGPGSNGTIGTGAIINNGSFIVNRTAPFALAQAISGTGSLTKLGTNTLTLTGNNTYTGNTFITGGALVAQGGNAIGDLSAVSVTNTGLLNLSNASETIGSLAGNSSVVLNSHTLTTGGNNASTTFSGFISGSGGIVKTGTSTFELTGNNSYTGATTINEGTLRNNGSLTNQGGLTVAAGAVLTGSGNTGGSTTISGTHRPGNSPGIDTHTDLTYNAGSLIEWELIANAIGTEGMQYDRIAVTGNLLVNATSTIDLVFNLDSTVDWTDTFWGSNQSWLFYDVSGSTTGAFTLGTISEDSFANTLASIRPDASFSIGYSGSDVFINYAVPEPGAALLFGLGAALVLWRRRSA